MVHLLHFTYIYEILTGLRYDIWDWIKILHRTVRCKFSKMLWFSISDELPKFKIIKKKHSFGISCKLYRNLWVRRGNCTEVLIYNELCNVWLAKFFLNIKLNLNFRFIMFYFLLTAKISASIFAESISKKLTYFVKNFIEY